MPKTEEQNLQKLVQSGGWDGNYLIPKSTQSFFKNETKFCNEDRLQNSKMYQYENIYLTSTKTSAKAFLPNLLLSPLELKQRFRTLRRNVTGIIR